MDIQVPESDPGAFERAFCSKHEALGLKTTAGSGSKWGDGDAREVLDRSKLQFALECKCRFTSSNMRPRPSEWKKAMDQLRKRDPEAVRLFAVYVAEKERVPVPSYSVTIPEIDLERLTGRIGSAPDPAETFRISKEKQAWDTCFRFDFSGWKNLYESIKSYRN
jgi:hypothetical protein